MSAGAVITTTGRSGPSAAAGQEFGFRYAGAGIAMAARMAALAIAVRLRARNHRRDGRRSVGAPDRERGRRPVRLDERGVVGAAASNPTDF